MMFVVCRRMILRESGYPRYLHSSVLLGGTLLIFGGNTHNDTSLSNGAKCFSADFLAYDIGLWRYFTACLIYTLPWKSLRSVIFIKCFCKTFILLTKAAFICVKMVQITLWNIIKITLFIFIYQFNASLPGKKHWPQTYGNVHLSVFPHWKPKENSEKDTNYYNLKSYGNSLREHTF